MAMDEPWIMCAMAIVPSLVSTMMEEHDDDRHDDDDLRPHASNLTP